MKDLIEALQIFLKYGNPTYPTSCTHDTLYIMDIDIKDVSAEDIVRLDELNFFWSNDMDCFMSFHYGSA